MVKKNPLDDLSPEQIREYLAEREQRDKADAREKIEAFLIEQYGQDWQQRTGLRLVGIDAEAKPERKPIPQKYQNPSDPTQTWSGQGNPPSWLRPFLDKAKIDWKAVGNGQKIRAWLDKNGFQIKGQTDPFRRGKMT